MIEEYMEDIGGVVRMKKKVSDAQKRATEKFEKRAYDRVLVRFPKGTKERIQATGDSLNGYIVKAVLKSLEKSKKST